MGELEKSVALVLDQYKNAVFAKDAAALIRLYDYDVRVFDAWGVWSYEGSEAWLRAVEAWLSSLGSERVVVSFDDTQVVAQADFALVSTIVTYAGLSDQGDALRSMQNRLTWGIRLGNNAPTIVHEHTSAPLGFEDMKAILQRNPGD